MLIVLFFIADRDWGVLFNMPHRRRQRLIRKRISQSFFLFECYLSNGISISMYNSMSE